MEDAIPKAKFPSNPLIPQKNRDKKSFQREWDGKDRLDDKTQNKLRRNKLYFTCKEPWEPGHKCLGKGKVHYIEVMSYINNEEHTKPTRSSEPSNSKGEKSHEEAKGDERPCTRVKNGIVATLGQQ